MRALCGVDFSARTGSVLGLLGPNGVGKTTAVRIHATLLKPDAGSARVAGLDMTIASVMRSRPVSATESRQPGTGAPRLRVT